MPAQLSIMAFSPHFLLLYTFLGYVQGQADVHCYFGPEPGDIDPTMKACPGVNASHPGPCCRNNGVDNIDVCLSNGLCWSAGSLFLYEGQCTDQAYAAKNCLSNCRDTGVNMDSGTSA